MTNPDKDITPAILLQHMQGMEKRINKRFNGVDERLEHVEERLGHVEGRLGHVENRLKNVEKCIEHVEQDTFILVTRSNPVHQRLDTIEKIQLPKIRKSVRNLSKKFSDHIALPAHHSALRVS